MSRKAVSDTARIVNWFKNANIAERRLMREVIAGICDEADPKPERKTRSDSGTTRKKGEPNVSAAAN